MLSNDSEVIGSTLSTKYIVAGKQVCKKSWSLILPVAERTVTSLLEKVAAGQVS